MDTLTEKGWSRLYVRNQDDVDRVVEIVRELDSFEFDYMPEGWVAAFDEFPNVVYTGKFGGLCMTRLVATCWSRGIACFVFDARYKNWVHIEIPGRGKLPVEKLPARDLVQRVAALEHFTDGISNETRS